MQTKNIRDPGKTSLSASKGMKDEAFTTIKSIR
jgi:hypothetical protein